MPGSTTVLLAPPRLGCDRSGYDRYTSKEEESGLCFGSLEWLVICRQLEEVEYDFSSPLFCSLIDLPRVDLADLFRHFVFFLLRASHEKISITLDRWKSYAPLPKNHG